MATQYSFGKIVTSGLVFAVDTADRNSYTSGSTTFRDLSENRRNGTLTNSPTYNSANGGSIVLNGTTQYIDYGNNTLGVEVQDKTACAWIYKTSSGGIYGIIDKDFDNGDPNYGGWGFWIYSTDKLTYWAQSNKDLIDTGTSVGVNSWRYVCVSWNNTSKSATFYLNGTLNSTVTNATIVEKVSDTTTLKIGAARNVQGHFPGRVSCVSVYNRQLTASEILQNYNATKTRFGL